MIEEFLMQTFIAHGHVTCELLLSLILTFNRNYLDSIMKYLFIRRIVLDQPNKSLFLRNRFSIFHCNINTDNSFKDYLTTAPEGMQ